MRKNNHWEPKIISKPFRIYFDNLLHYVNNYKVKSGKIVLSFRFISKLIKSESYSKIMIIANKQGLEASDALSQAVF